MEHLSNQLATLQLSNLEHQPPESRKPKNGEVVSFEQAVSQQPIKGAPLERLKQVLRQIMVKIGLRQTNWPEAEEKEILIKHIADNYGGHTHDEVLLAFDMAIAGKLDVEVNCYENFSCLYFSTIMNAYRQWAKDQYKEIKPTPVEQIFDLNYSDILEDTRNRIKEGAITWETVGVIMPNLYDFAVEAKLINPTPEEKRAYLQRAVEYRMAMLYRMIGTSKDGQRDFKRFMEMKEAGCFEGEEVNRLKNLSKKMILWDYLKQ